MAITTDNASNNLSFIQTLCDTDPNMSADRHIRCLAHIIHLCLEPALYNRAHAVARLRNLIKAIRLSNLRMSNFKNAVKISLLQYPDKHANSEFRKPILDVETRWNSSCNMIERALSQKFTEQHGRCTETRS